MAVTTFHIRDPDSIMRKVKITLCIHLLFGLTIYFGLLSSQAAAGFTQTYTELPSKALLAESPYLPPAKSLAYELFAEADQNQTPDTEPEVDSSPVWNILILALVIAISGSIAALPVAAMRQWRGVWKKLAMLPLAIIIIWMVVIALSKLINPDSHSLWVSEVFSWAMITSVYMVILITAKRAFEKEDRKEGPLT